MAGPVRSRIRQITGIFIADRLDHISINPAYADQADLIFIGRAAVVP